MKKIFSVLLLSHFALNVFGQNILRTTKANGKSFPTNLYEGNFNNIKKFDGKIVAFNAVIEKMKLVEIKRHSTNLK